MNSRSAFSLPRRLGLALALWALLGQLCLGQASAAHWAQMLTLQYMHSDICSAHGGQFELAPQDGDATPAAGAHASHCPVCSAGAAAAPPPWAGALVRVAEREPLCTGLRPLAGQLHGRAYERPPAQAPPWRRYA